MKKTLATLASLAILTAACEYPRLNQRTLDVGEERLELRELDKRKSPINYLTVKRRDGKKIFAFSPKNDSLIYIEVDNNIEKKKFKFGPIYDAAVEQLSKYLNMISERDSDDLEKEHSPYRYLFEE